MVIPRPVDPLQLVIPVVAKPLRSVSLGPG